MRLTSQIHNYLMLMQAGFANFPYKKTPFVKVNLFYNTLLQVQQAWG